MRCRDAVPRQAGCAASSRSWDPALEEGQHPAACTLGWGLQRAGGYRDLAKKRQETPQRFLGELLDFVPEQPGSVLAFSRGCPMPPHPDPPARRQGVGPTRAGCAGPSLAGSEHSPVHPADGPRQDDPCRMDRVGAFL